ncbi:alpha/beta hydrolase [Hymenobacter sp. BT18]|uniref:alpha/beta fold hydrolase n=1 Tax=Hymenobacter sp. BT18 TaxID=2835648 RepID=UPI00143ED913|nr:alpha/beta hydrolase [Hymenobacter sp. BT18]QIX61310.1 alpha/beta hydrolase [Hymenobacter sp. BT18]
MSHALSFIGLHYWAGAGHAFQPVADALGSEYAFFAPDLGGFGTAPAPHAGYSVDAYADEVALFIRQQPVGRYVLVGHSMGGKIALALAAQRPPGLAGVVLLSPSPPTPEPMTDEDRQASLRAWGKPAAAENTLRKITARPLPQAWQQQIIADNLRSSQEAWEAWLLRGSRENIADRLWSINVPCTIVAGDADAVMSPSLHGLETLPLLPAGTHLEIISGAGHLLPYEAPEEVARLLRAFAQGLE